MDNDAKKIHQAIKLLMKFEPGDVRIRHPQELTHVDITTVVRLLMQVDNAILIRKLED